MSQRDFYITRAAEAQALAEAATLANVRDRHLRAFQAWEEMAERATRTDEAREATLRAKEALAG